MELLVIIRKDQAEWLKVRRDSLGASDTVAVPGIPPWEANVQLWGEECRLVRPEDIRDKPAVQYGNDAEPLLRQFFTLDHPEYWIIFTPYKIVGHPALPFITCMPGEELEEIATGRRDGLEIRTTEILSATGWPHWEDRIPDNYYAQVCHQMLAVRWGFMELLVQIRYVTADGADRKEVRRYKIGRADTLEDIALIQREAPVF